MQKRKRYCKRCGEELSPGQRSKYCYACWVNVQKEAIMQMKEKSGPVYDKWKRRWEEGVRRKLNEPLP